MICYILFQAYFNCFCSDIEEVLAWASAQIHCQCTVDDALVKFPSTASQEELATASQDTSFIPCRGKHSYSLGYLKLLLFSFLQLLCKTN